jgi:4-alpha-glucanotransferase
MPFPRASGILLHPTSLPSPFGIGDFGSGAYQFVDFLAETRQQLWQILPLGPTGYGNSPYLCYSALAGNHLLISPEKLLEKGWLSETELSSVPDFPSHRVDYDRVRAWKMPLLRKAYQRFHENLDPDTEGQFHHFCESKSHWLEDYALFMSVKQAHHDSSWHAWEEGLAHRHPSTLDYWRNLLADEIEFHKFLQFEFFRQWKEIKQYANDRGIQIFGDIPFYVAHDSADVWANPEIFNLNPETCQPSVMAGVPPDYFSETGQLWGNPTYNWQKLREQDFAWWVGRFQEILEYVDWIRIDHFRGFAAFWAIAEGETTAMNGQWVESPGEEFFQYLGEKLGQLPIIAEDLGIITPDVEALRDKFGFPGMKILHFAFGSGTDNPYLPFNCNRNSVIYTGTHDNNTTLGWFEEISHEERQNVIRYLGELSSEGMPWDLIRLALSSVCDRAVIPLQDILELGSESRMNLPSQPEGHWEWRYHADGLTQERKDRLRNMTEIYGRTP